MRPTPPGTPFLTQRRRRPVGCVLLMAAAGMVLVTAAGLVVQEALDSDPPGASGDTRPGAAVPLPGVTPTGSTGELLGPLRVLDGKRQAAGVQVGYPHTTQGAVSATVHYYGALGSTLDPARSEQLAPVIAAPAWKSAAAELSQGPRNARKALGLPETGGVPDGASLLLTPLAYQVREVEADSVTVLLLGYYQTTLPGQDAENRIGVFPAQLVWADGDWKLPKPSLASDYSSLSAQPGSAEAHALGWQELITP